MDLRPCPENVNILTKSHSMGKAHGPSPWAGNPQKTELRKRHNNWIKFMQSSGLRGWIRLVEALWMRTMQTSSFLLGGQNIQKQLSFFKYWPKSGFSPHSYQLRLGYIRARGFHSRVIVSWLRWERYMFFVSNLCRRRHLPRPLLSILVKYMKYTKEVA